ncbi:MAG: hypothetical protein IPI87_09545 [Betaproteobacteria bacterium]|nr:hypothetical protein [Betaproteobacteria bacterium]
MDEPIYRILANPNTPLVSVVEDTAEVIIIVDQEPIFHKKHAADKKMTWTLDRASRRDWKLVDVVIIPPGDTVIKDCAQDGAADHRFQCANRGDSGTYKYTMTVQRRSDGTRVTSPDPFIRNGR